MEMNRRRFIECASLAGTSLAINGYAKPASPKEVNVGVIGVHGKGWSDWTALLSQGANIVALCDVDKTKIDIGLKKLKDSGKDTSKVKVYSDFRKMLDACKEINSVTVSIPDHMHGLAAITAMRHGCNVYVQKPLVRTLWEVRQFEKVAKECGVATQMGNQGSAAPILRRGVEVLQSGLIGKVKEVHVWTDRPIWPQGMQRPAGADPVPPYVDWESWIGIAKMRPFKLKAYHPFNWRGVIDFGTGAFGDSACHTMNLPVRGLCLGKVESAECLKIVGKNSESYPHASIVKMHYAARKDLPGVDLFWYDGRIKPNREIMHKVIATFGRIPEVGSMMVGEKGIMVSSGHYGDQNYVAMNGEEKLQWIMKHPACAAVPRSIPRCRCNNMFGQHVEFFDACRGTGKCYSDIEHSIPLTEGILVGCIAQQVPGKLNWDALNMRFDNSDANALVRPYIRKGWEF